ncbi:MAG: hypothetical protein ABEJ85_01980 [Haloarculaceae archaeon]
MPDRDMDEFLADHAEAFGALADETRLRILLEIVRRQGTEGPQSYAEVMDVADFEDSGLFNYHLEQLTGHFVMEEDDKYVATAAGVEVAQLLASHRLETDRTEVDPVSLGVPCNVCGTALIAEFGYDFYVSCPSCDDPRVTHRIDPELAAEMDARTLALRVDEKARAHVAHLRESYCLDCGGETETILIDASATHYDRRMVDVFVNVACENCRRGVGLMTVGQYLLGHPTVRDYCTRNGIDLDANPVWEYEWAATDTTTHVRSRDPWEIEKVATVDGCRLVALVADDGDVSHVDHVRLRAREDSGRDGTRPV